MRKCKLGNSNINISILGLGCWSFGGNNGDYWGNQDQKIVNKIVDHAIDNGITYFDTAEIYNNGASERSLGLALKNNGRRRDIIIGTKLNPSNAESKNVERSIENSLKNLDTDYIDIYMLHWPITPHSIAHFTKDSSITGANFSIKSTFEKLLEYQKNGKIKHIGISNHGTSQMQEIIDLDIKMDIVVNQLPYNLLSRAIEKDIVPFCNKYNIGIIAYMALQQGILTGKYHSAAEIPAPQAHSRHFKQKRGLSDDGKQYSRHNEDGCEEKIFKFLNEMREIAIDEGITMAQLSLAWVMSNQNVTCTLMGARNLKQLKSNLESLDYSISQSIKNKLNKLSYPILEKLGYNPDYYENRKNSRIY